MAFKVHKPTEVVQEAGKKSYVLKGALSSGGKSYDIVFWASNQERAKAIMSLERTHDKIVSTCSAVLQTLKTQESSLELADLQLTYCKDPEELNLVQKNHPLEDRFKKTVLQANRVALRSLVHLFSDSQPEKLPPLDTDSDSEADIRLDLDDDDSSSQGDNCSISRRGTSQNLDKTSETTANSDDNATVRPHLAEIFSPLSRPESPQADIGLEIESSESGDGGRDLRFSIRPSSPRTPRSLTDYLPPKRSESPLNPAQEKRRALEKQKEETIKQLQTLAKNLVEEKEIEPETDEAFWRLVYRIYETIEEDTSIGVDEIVRWTVESIEGLNKEEAQRLEEAVLFALEEEIAERLASLKRLVLNPENIEERDYQVMAELVSEACKLWGDAGRVGIQKPVQYLEVAEWALAGIRELRGLDKRKLAEKIAEMVQVEVEEQLGKE
ncbi:MAG: hypothetical protein A3E80_03565 [Chlamydiae bacterium RIFCSPHIGHO2_12_FULL_49_9]|nr:MAG: hypothetical protein A3E80_03565 [Chlamydiae bacterium RIFCSPHIGHO2_12_FULL_49_9]